jgi:hypothetical protein
VILKNVNEPKQILNCLSEIYSNSNPQVKEFFLSKKKEFIGRNPEIGLYCIYEKQDLSTYPVPVVEKNVLFLNSFNVTDIYKNNIEFIGLLNNVLTGLKEKYNEIILLSSPFNDDIDVMLKNTGFAPLLNYENYLRQSKFWMFKSFNSSFIKRIPMNYELLRKVEEDKDNNKISFCLYANFQEFFHCEVYHYLNFIQKKYSEDVDITVIDISSKKHAIEYGTDFCILMDNNIINPVNLMKLDMEEYIKAVRG